MRIDNCGPKLAPVEIEMLAADIGIELPNDYRDFLLSCNGGTPTQDNNIVDIPDAPDSPTDIQVFFGIGRDVPSSDISWNVALVRERCADVGLVPIACDSGGNLFCLRNNEGQHDVLYYDLDSSVGASYPVASNFSAFLDKLRSF